MGLTDRISKVINRKDKVPENEENNQVGAVGAETVPGQGPGSGPGPGERETWSAKMDFLLSVIGYAVDLGNVWRFPYICYKNGGGAFLLPYTICFVFIGLPLFFMELALGQFHKTGCLSLWKTVSPAMKGIGFTIICVNCYTSFFYNTVIAESFFYLFASFTTSLPWRKCGNSWNDESCFEIGQRPPDNYSGSIETPAAQYHRLRVWEKDKSSGLGDLGGLQWELSLCLLLTHAILFVCVWRGIKSIGKVVWITATAPYIILLCLLIRGFTLPGAGKGIVFYLTPVPEKLLEVTVWKEAAQQICFSLGLGFGVLLTLASYNPFHNNCYRDALLASSVNCFTSILAGFVIFSVLGYLSEETGKPISEVATEGPGLVFEAYPEALANMPAAPLWSIIFFFMLIFLGLDSTFGGLECVITAFCDELPTVIGQHRSLFSLAVVIFMFLGALPTTARGGDYMSRIYADFGTSNVLIIIVLCEALAVCYGYGYKRLKRDVKAMIGSSPGLYFVVCWAAVSPILIFIMTLFSLGDLVFLSKDDPDNYPPWSDVLAYSILISSLLWIPGYVVFYYFRTTSHTFKGKLLEMFRAKEKDEIDYPVPEWGPYTDENNYHPQMTYQTSTKNTFFETTV